MKLTALQRAYRRWFVLRAIRQGKQQGTDPQPPAVAALRAA